MTELTTTPPALRWVATFLAACAVLGLFLGFRDQIRKNPPDWYTGAETGAVVLPATPDGARDAVPFDPDARPPAAPAAPTPASKPAGPPPAAEPEDTAEATPQTGTPSVKSATVPPPVLTPAPAPAATTRPKPTAPAPRPAPAPADPVGDILEGQKQSETPAAVPY